MAKKPSKKLKLLGKRYLPSACEQTKANARRVKQIEKGMIKVTT